MEHKISWLRRSMGTDVTGSSCRKKSAAFAQAMGPDVKYSRVGIWRKKTGLTLKRV